MIVPNLIYNLPKKLQYSHQLFADSEMPPATNLQSDNPKENLNNNIICNSPNSEFQNMPLHVSLKSGHGPCMSVILKGSHHEMQLKRSDIKNHSNKDKLLH